MSEQTKVILGAVDARFQKVDERFEVMETKLEVMSNRIGNLEQRMDEFDRKIDRLTTTLDNFLKRLTDHEDELILMKADIDQIKAVLKEKLGVEILVQGR